MEEITRQTVTTGVRREASTPVSGLNRVDSTTANYYTTENIAYFILGLLEFLLTFRLIFKLMGANPGSGFVSMIYGITSPFVMPFTGIFRQSLSKGVDTTSVLEPATIVAMVVYALLTWGIVKLIAIMTVDRGVPTTA